MAAKRIDTPAWSPSSLWPRFVAAAAPCAALIALSPSEAGATDTRIFGTKGGSPFRSLCAGGVVNGINGNAGAWIDNLRPTCAEWDRQKRRLMSVGPVRQVFGLSRGGGPASVSCPDGYMVKAMTFSDTKGDGPTSVIHSIDLVCVSLFSADEVTRSFGSRTRAEGRRGAYAAEYHVRCPPKEVAIGIVGRSGLYIDALGLVCGLGLDNDHGA